MRTAFATAIGGITLYFSYGLAFSLRVEHDMKLSPHDGQAWIDVLAFAILAAPIATIIIVVLFLWITRPGQPPKDR